MTRTTALAIAVLLFASALGYWGVSGYRKGQQQKAVSALVGDASQRLESALALETEASAASSQQTVNKLDEQAQEVDRHVMELHDMSSGPNRALVAAADDYLLTVRQILRQQVGGLDQRGGAHEGPIGEKLLRLPRLRGGARPAARRVPRLPEKAGGPAGNAAARRRGGRGRAQALRSHAEAYQRERGAGEAARCGALTTLDRRKHGFIRKSRDRHRCRERHRALGRACA